MNYSIERPPLHANFWLPSRKQLLELKVGDTVKLIFRSGEDVERMWVIITAQQHDSEWSGVIDNDPVGQDMSKALPYATEVKFHPLDIIQLPTTSTKLAAFFGKLKGRTSKSYLEKAKK